jgi:hypothetical protein
MPWTPPPPLRAAYEIAPTDPCLRTDMEVGAARVRRRTAARMDVVAIEWKLTPGQMVAFRDWYDTDLGGGVAWFTVDLDLGAGIVSCEAQFAEMWKATRPGLMWSVKASVKVR